MQTLKLSSTGTAHPAMQSTPISRYREHPRLCISTGRLLARSIRLTPPLPDDATLDLACGLARLTGQNVSVALTGPPDSLAPSVAQALARIQIDPALLEVVISIASIHAATRGRHSVEALLSLSELRDAGVQLALTGFGEAGTLDHIHHVPLSAVILEARLIRDIPGNAPATLRLRQVIDAARESHLSVVAAGIDTEAQRALLSGLGCTAGEGSLFNHGPP